MQQQLANQFVQIGAHPSGSVDRPEPLKDDGIKLGELVGWRGWKLDDNGFLRSMTSDALWAPGEPMYGNIKANEEHNGCYAYKLARDYLKAHALDIYGKVHMWGRCIEHEVGWRSEWMKIASLEAHNAKWDSLDAASAR